MPPSAAISKVLAEEQGLKLIHGGAALPRERDFSYRGAD